MEHRTYEEMLRELVLFSLEKAKGDLTAVYNCLMGVCKEDGALLFAEVHRDRMRDKKQKFLQVKFQLDIREKKFTVQDIKHSTRACRGCGISILEDIYLSTGQGSVQPYLRTNLGPGSSRG